MTDDRPDTKAEARQHVREIRTKNESKSRDLAHAAEMLRKGMFPERVRFLLEFLQNAADATAEGEQCKVDIQITDEYVVVQNDAQLFTKSDVRQLCGVGRTHKRFDPEYIGYWGFGFKSVFRITETPYVISPPYQFKFDRNADEWNESDEVAWEITPLWAADEDVPDALEGIETEGKNTFFLPLKRRGRDSYRAEIAADIQNRVDDILKSELPVFLPDLETVQIRDELADDEHRTLSATVQGERANGEVVETDKGEQWWVYRETHRVPETIRTHPETEEWNREMVEKRELVVGISINEDGNLEPRRSSPQIAIYSFTPLGDESVGLPFLLQGDFLAEAGRRRADTDIRWNHWLAEKAGETVVQAVKHLFNDEEWRTDVYDAVVPDSKIKHRLFGGHDRQEAWPGLDAELSTDRTEWAGTDAVIVDWFANNQTILTESGEYRKPENIRIPEDSNVRNAEERIQRVISPADLERLTGADYVATEVGEGWKSKVQRRLLGHKGRIRSSTIRTFVTENPEWLRSKARDDDAVEWFATLYGVLEDEIRSKSSSTQRRRRKELEDAPLVLTEEGVVAPSEDNIVIPTNEDEAETIFREVAETADAVRVHPELADDSRSKRFLKRFCIDEVDAEWAVEEAILPRLNDFATSPERIVQLTSHVREYLGAGYKTQGMMVATKDGGTAPADEVWFADPYESAYDVETVFGAERKYLSDAYRQQYDWDDEWCEFFEDIGVTRPAETRSDVLQALATLPSRDVDDAEVHATRLYRILLREFDSLPTSTSVEQIGGETGVPILADDGGFRQAGTLFVPDDDAVRQAFADTDDITFAWVPSPDRVDAEPARIFDLLDRLGAQSGAQECTESGYVGEELEEQDSTPRLRLEDAWEKIRPEVGTEKRVPDVKWVDEMGVRYQLDGEEQLVPCDPACIYDSDGHCVYLTPNFTADWEALASALADELGADKHQIATHLVGATPTLEDRAVEAIQRHERDRGFDIVVDVRHKDYHDEYDVRGCDVFVKRDEDDDPQYIEIKARRDQSSPIRLIGHEPEKAVEEGGKYYLYVVSCSRSGEPRHFRRLRDPADNEYIEERVWRFNTSELSNGEKVELE
ncbi:sacsin N-terminal ATP-binding-like domain-containing protein [Halorussus pelagicus]|uniref:sacsin N-terminal ATP-binding-like domain-containing protein n=1 Tax=Halorussus pelagicus TaxID=2505977 RepID=UPI000FFB9C51|nr:DUF3883 domain-containing protein [Halorussus pelagicus]